MSLQLRVIRSNEEFEPLREEWDDLLARAGVSNAYLTHDWLISWWEAYREPGDRLEIICCYDDEPDQLVGLLPLYYTVNSGVVPVRRLTQLGRCQIGPGCVADARVADAVYTTVAEHLFATRADWDTFMLQYVDADSGFVSTLMRRFTRKGQAAVSCSDTCPALTLPDTWEAFLSGISRNRRHHVRQDRRRLDSLGRVVVEEITDADQLGEALEEATRLFVESMQRKFERPYRESASYRELLRRASPRLLKSGRLRLRFLKVDDSRVAFMYEIRHMDALFAYQTGLEASWAQHGAGTVLHSYTIERAIEEGCRVYDLGIGWSETKRHWGVAGVRALCDITLSGTSPVAVLSAEYVRISRLLRSALRRATPMSLKKRLALERSWRQLQRF